MTARRVALLVAILLGARGAWAVSLPEAWLSVQERLVAGDLDGVTEELAELRSTAEAVQAERLTPYARALVAEAASREHGSAERLLEEAIALDDQLPSARFALAARRWAEGERLAAASAYGAGWMALLRSEAGGTALAKSVVVWAILGVAVGLISILLVQTLRTVRRIGYDALWIGRSVFDPANAWVFAVVLFVLPLFAGLDPMWVLVYLAVMGWVYLSRVQRSVGIAGIVLLALAVPALEAWQQLALHGPTLPQRISDMLLDRRVDLATLRELSSLEEDFAGEEDYHVVLGELYRMHGEIDRAREHFQRSVVAGGTRADALVFLANLSLEDGDVQRAIQLYSRAIDADPRSSIAYHNLSSAYDANRRFQEGDVARQRAREIAGGPSDVVGLGSDGSRLRYPRLGEQDVEEMVRAAPEAAVVQLSEPRSYDLLRAFVSPFSLLFWVAGALGVAVLLVRHRWLGPARECTKCGKVFRAEESDPASAYFQQCVSVYLRRDRVSIEQQTAKGRQVQRWERACSISRRATGVLLPGGYHVVSRDPWVGGVLAAGFWLAVVGAAVWAPFFLPGVEPQLRIAPVTVSLALVAGLLWLTSAVGSWYRR